MSNGNKNQRCLKEQLQPLSDAAATTTELTTMQNDSLRSLLDKYATNDLSEEEWAALNEWYHDLHFGDQPFDEWVKMAGSELQLSQKLYSNFETKLYQRQSMLRRRKIYRFTAAAAILICVAGASYFFSKADINRATSIPMSGKETQHKIIPGTNKAVLTLANGQQIVLSDVAQGKLAEQGKVAIQKTAAGELTYNTTGENSSGEIIINTISTPRGGKYNLVLADGTKIWLNSASSLRFPAAFNGQTREVTLTGEGYFEVAHDQSHPFIVRSGEQSVEVTGTHFNVSAYPDETQMQTTLLSGGVTVLANNLHRELKPGQQSVFDASGDNIEVSDVNAEDAVAWMNDFFLFQNESIQSVMRKISRWYDVEVEFKSGIHFNQQYGGSITRYTDLTKVLRMLEVTGNVKFKIDGRRIIVSSN